MLSSSTSTADGLRAVSDPRAIATLPEIPGVLVFMPKHVGVYIGGGRVIECYGFKNVAERPISAQKWTHWGKCPWIEYPDAALRQEQPVQKPATMTYTVQSDRDTLWDLSRRFLGSGSRWPEIAALNGNLDPKKVKVGMKLKIPVTGGSQ